MLDPETRLDEIALADLIEQRLVKDILSAFLKSRPLFGLGLEAMRRMLSANVLNVLFEKARFDPFVQNVLDGFMARVVTAEHDHLDELEVAIERSALLDHLEWGLALLEAAPSTSDPAWRAYRLLARHKLHVRSDIDHRLGRLVPAQSSPFDEQAYLLANPDVAHAVSRGDLASGRAHFEQHGRTESRKMRLQPAPPLVFVVS